MGISSPISFLGVGISGTRSLLGGEYVLTPPNMGHQGVGTHPSPRHRIQGDTVGKRAVRILLERCLVDCRWPESAVSSPVWRRDSRTRRRTESTRR